MQGGHFATIQYILSVKLLLSRFHTYKGKHTNFHKLTSSLLLQTLWFYTRQYQLLLLWFTVFFFSFSFNFKLVILRRKFTLKHISHLIPIIMGSSTTIPTPKSSKNPSVLILGTTHNEEEIFTVNEFAFFDTHTSRIICLKEIVFIITLDPAVPNHRNKICMNVVSGGFSLQVRKD